MRHLSTAVVPGDAVYVLSEEGTTALSGPHLESLVPLLDGTRDFAALRRELPADVPAEEASGVLTRLAEAGLIGLRPAASTPELAYWDAVDADADAASARGRV